MVGNGVMNLQTLENSRFEYMIARRFVDPIIVPLYQNSCKANPPEPVGCALFKQKFYNDTKLLNMESKSSFNLDIYDYCYYNDSLLVKVSSNDKKIHNFNEVKKVKTRIEAGQYSCSKDNGILTYFDYYRQEYRAMHPYPAWNGPCASNIRYKIDPDGSMSSYRHILQQSKS